MNEKIEKVVKHEIETLKLNIRTDISEEDISEVVEKEEVEGGGIIEFGEFEILFGRTNFVKPDGTEGHFYTISIHSEEDILVEPYECDKEEIIKRISRIVRNLANLKEEGFSEDEDFIEDFILTAFYKKIEEDILIEQDEKLIKIEEVKKYKFVKDMIKQILEKEKSEFVLYNIFQRRTGYEEQAKSDFEYLLFENRFWKKDVEKMIQISASESEEGFRRIFEGFIELKEHDGRNFVAEMIDLL